MKIDQNELSSLFQEIVINELNGTYQGSHNIIKAYSFKFLIYFRSLIPEDWIESTINLLLSIMNNNEELYIYGPLICIQKFLQMRNINNLNDYTFKPILNKGNIFNNLIQTVGLLAQNMNEIAIKCLFKIVELLEIDYFPQIFDYLITLVTNIIIKLQATKESDINSEYTYFFFESLSILIRKYFSLQDKSNYINLREILNSSLAQFLHETKLDIKSFVFQIFSLELSLDNEINELQNNWLIYILNESHWTLQENYLFEPFIQYLKVLIQVNRSILLSENILNSLSIIIIKVSLYYFILTSYAI